LIAERGCECKQIAVNTARGQAAIRKAKGRQ
jgi:hypothetical protein